LQVLTLYRILTDSFSESKLSESYFPLCWLQTVQWAKTEKKIINTSKRTFIKEQLLMTALPVLFIINMAACYFAISY